MPELTSKERLLRAIRHEETDRVPVSPRYFDHLYGVEGCECVNHCMRFQERYEHDLTVPYGPPQNNYLLDHVGPYNDLPGVSVDLHCERSGETLVVRRRWKTPAGDLTDARSVSLPGSMSVFPHVIEPPVKDRKDLDKIRFLLQPPELAYVGEIPLLRRLIGDRGFLLVQATQGVEQFLMDALGVEHALLLYYDDRELLVELLRLFNDHHRAILKRILREGVDIVFEPWYNCSMSVGWSPAQYREIFLPRIRENVELIHSYGALVDHYNDGKMSDVLEDLAGVGCDVIETLAPPPLGDVDLADAKKRVGAQTCLKGHIDQVNLVCYGKPPAIREAVRAAIETAAPGGGFILGTADSIRPESPPENVSAYFSAALEFGRLG
ncbi:MAG: uroporphyrinogen decarboxylase family protein [Planctomycetota bacterium]